MSQVTSPNSLSLDSGVAIFTVPSDPNSLVISPRLPGAASLVGQNESLALCSIGSLALDYGGGRLWLKTAAPTPAAPTGTWVQLT